MARRHRKPGDLVDVQLNQLSVPRCLRTASLYLPIVNYFDELIMFSFRRREAVTGRLLLTIADRFRSLRTLVLPEIAPRTFATIF